MTRQKLVTNGVREEFYDNGVQKTKTHVRNAPMALAAQDTVYEEML